MQVFLLDRNVISVMKEFLAEEETEARKYGTKLVRYPYVADKIQTTKHADLLRLLLNKDSRKNLFSIITSAIEGGYGRRYDVDEYKSSLAADGAIVRRFFRFARTDERILEDIHNKPENRDLIIKEQKSELYESYLSQIAPYALSTHDSFDVIRDRIVSSADPLGIPRSHFVVVSCLSAAFGAIASRRLITPKKRKAGDCKPKYYNTLNDLMVASRIAQFRALDKSIEYEFITLDERLSTFIDLCPATDSSNDIGEQGVGTLVRISPRKELFPNLTQEQYVKLMTEDLGGSSDEE